MKSSESSRNTPLELTVHNLLEHGRQASDIDTQSRTRSGRWKMLFVLMLCAAPVIASYLTYYVIRPQYGKFFTVKSFGELVQPQRPMPDIPAAMLSGQAVSLVSLRGQWLFVRVGGGACGKSCERDLYLQRQLREGLGAEKDRLDWVWLITDDAALPSALSARLQDPKLKGFDALRVSQSDVTAWLQGGEEHLYLVDPQGNYMMRFPENLTLQEAVKVKADINRLLRASAFWDTPGRGAKP